MSKLSRAARGATEKNSDTLDRHHEEEGIYFRAQAFHKAAKILVNAFDGGTVAGMDSNVLPIILLYRNAAELYLKEIILGHGGSFLPVRPVPARIHGTHSLRVLVTLTSRILEKVGWDQGFTTEGVADLCDLRAVIGKLEALDTSVRAFRRKNSKAIVTGSLAATISEFAKKIDAVLDVLDGAADGLAAMADTGGLDGESEVEHGKEPVQ